MLSTSGWLRLSSSSHTKNLALVALMLTLGKIALGPFWAASSTPIPRAPSMFIIPTSGPRVDHCLANST